MGISTIATGAATLIGNRPMTLATDKAAGHITSEATQLVTRGANEVAQLITYGATQLITKPSAKSVNNSTTKLIAEGSSKSVYEYSPMPHLVYYTPRFLKHKELQKEVNTAAMINHKLQKIGLSAKHVATSLIPSEICINNKFTIETERAYSDLEQEIRKDNLSFSYRLGLALQCLDGFRTLHAAGFVHGDIKPENILLYKEEGKTTVKISDWGKTKQQLPEETSYYLGNLHFSPPEYCSSHKGEVYSLGIVLLRIFEETILSQETNHGEMILLPTTLKQKYRLLESDYSEKNLRGFIKYIYSHSESSQPKKWLRLWRAWRSQGSTIQQQEKNQQLTHAYIDKLSQKIAEQKICSKQVATELGSLIKAMTYFSPDQRPTSHRAFETLKGIVALENKPPTDPIGSLFSRFIINPFLVAREIFDEMKFCTIGLL